MSHRTQEDKFMGFINTLLLILIILVVIREVITHNNTPVKPATPVVKEGCKP